MSNLMTVAGWEPITVSASGVPSGAGLPQPIPQGAETLTATVTGTGVCSIALEVSSDLTNFTALDGTLLGAGSQGVSTMDGAGTYRFDVRGFRFWRYNCTSYTSGNLKVMTACV